MRVEVDQEGDDWSLTGFYGEPNTSHRRESWALLRNLAEQGTEPWVCLADFIEIIWDHEKSGQCLWGESQMREFRGAIEDSGLEDLGYEGTWFT